MNEQVRTPEQRISRLGNDHRVVVEESVQALEHAPDGNFRPRHRRKGHRRLRVRDRPRLPGFNIRRDQPLQEILQQDSFVDVMTDGSFLAGDRNRATLVDVRRVHAQIHVVHDRAEQDQAVTGLDIRPDLFVAEGALIHPEIARVALADHGFTQEHGCDRNVGFLDQVEQRVLQPEAMKLYAGDDDGLPCVINHVGRLAESLPEGFGVADVLRFLGPV